MENRLGQKKWNVSDNFCWENRKCRVSGQKRGILIKGNLCIVTRSEGYEKFYLKSRRNKKANGKRKETKEVKALFVEGHDDCYGVGTIAFSCRHKLCVRI